MLQLFRWVANGGTDIERIALITGAASGIGRAVAHTFVLEGCTRLVLADLNSDGLQTVSDEVKALDSNVQTCLVTCDISVEADVQRMVDEAVRVFGGIHYAVNNAGISSKPRVRTHELEVEAYDRVQNVNQRGLWLCERAELRQMLTQEPILRSRYVYAPAFSEALKKTYRFQIWRDPSERLNC